MQVVLRPVNFADSVVVTATRGAERLPSAASSTVLTSAELSNMAAGALDDALRSTPGFTLFRRSSSRVANPTTQGVTLRGVSGSGASRTLVLADGVPLNDPFGSWVYWNRIPLAAVDRVEVVRGATGDLYGAGALGGVVQLLTVQPSRTRARATFDGGSHDTFRGSLFAARGEERLERAAAPTKACAPTASSCSAPKCAAPSTRAPTATTRPASATVGRRGNNWHVNGARRRLYGRAQQRHVGAGQHHRLEAVLGRCRRLRRRRRARAPRRRQLAGLLPDVLGGGRGGGPRRPSGLTFEQFIDTSHRGVQRAVDQADSAS